MVALIGETALRVPTIAGTKAKNEQFSLSHKHFWDIVRRDFACQLTKEKMNFRSGHRQNKFTAPRPDRLPPPAR
jgi:hypothetical protein